MANLTFSDTYNMVAYLSKSVASAGFDQIVDFLNTQVIQYALKVNPTIYVSCIKQFWAMASIKKANDVVNLRALIDGKKLARMGYEKSPPKLTFYKAFFSTQWKFLIHTLVQCVSAKRNAWNEFSCSMASAIICLATALEILKLKKRVKKLEKKRRSKSSGLKRLRNMGTSQRRKDDDNASTKEINDVEPTVFDDEEMAKRLHDKEVEQAVAKEKQEKVNLEKAKGLQQQYDEKHENIDWNVIAEQIQERHLDNIRKYLSLKRKPVSIAQTRKNMIIYLKNMAGYKMEHFRGLTYDKVRPIFEREHNKVQTLFKPDKHVEEPQKKRVAEETLRQVSFKKLKVVEVSGFESTQDTPTKDPKK
nr:hypothetical protein [Tanacetum cinerariifolium]